MGGGAAFFRFTDTTAWLTRSEKPQRVDYLMERMGQRMMQTGRFTYFAELLKARDGAGAGKKIAFTFDKLQFAEQGLVLRSHAERGGDKDEAEPAETECPV